MVTTVHKPVLIVIAGPNGSGKTTITTQILHHEWMENAIYINPDQIANDKFGDWNSHEAISSIELISMTTPLMTKRRVCSSEWLTVRCINNT